MNRYIGIDIGGTKISVVKGDENGNIAEKIKFDTPENKDEAVEKIFDSALRLGECSAVGISCGGPLDSKKGKILSPPNLPGWDEVPIVHIAENVLKVPAFLRNDADACALAEWRWGAGKGCRNMIFLTFGTGMGAGLILNGALYEGSCGMAGEVGHIALEKDGPTGYGKAGSFEGFCSGGGIRQSAVRKAVEMHEKGIAPSFAPTKEDILRISAKTVAECANEGHKDAIEIYEECGTMLGRGLSVLIDILNPERIVIGSIFTRSKALLEIAMKRAIEKEALTASASICQIVPSAFGESLGDIAALSVAADGLCLKESSK
ncbi:MAG: ROK family protein [Ruminococcaceae bacterium]|nr:ROK family protein [Oscillospiraceae bacterium]